MTKKTSKSTRSPAGSVGRKDFFGKIKYFLTKTFHKIEKRVGLVKNKKEKISIDKLDSDIQKLTIKDEKKEETSRISIDSRSSVRFRFFGLLFVGIGYLLSSTADILLLILTSLIISIAVESTILFFSKFMKRGFAIGLTYLLLLLFIFLVLIFVIIFVIKQSDFLIPLIVDLFNNSKEYFLTNTPEQVVGSITRLPEQAQNIIVKILHETNLFQQLVDILRSNVDTLLTVAKSSISNITNVITSFISGFTKTLIYSGLVFVLAILFSTEKKGIVNFLSSLGENKSVLRYKLEILYKKLGLRLQGQVFLMILVGLMTWFALLILPLFGVPIEGSGSLALLVGTLDAIPYLGPILGSIPVILVGIQGSGLLGGLVVLVVFVIIQQIESNILVPLVMEKSVGVSSALVFMCMILGGFLLGILGVFLSVPFAVILTLLLSDKFE